MQPTKIGFLPLYLKLYDELFPEMRETMEKFSSDIQTELLSKGIEVIPAPICRTEEEFKEAGKIFTDCSAVVCLHLAYSPSLESIDTLVSLNKPLIMLDTTMNSSFGKDATVDDLMNNHGIHGVQDLCSLLKRKGVQYFVEAGHWQESDVIEQGGEPMQGNKRSQFHEGWKSRIDWKVFSRNGGFCHNPGRFGKVDRYKG